MMMYGVYVVIYVLYMIHDLRRRQLELLASKAPLRAAELMSQTGCEKKKLGPCWSWDPCFTAARPLSHVFVLATMPLKPVSAARPLSHVVALAAKPLKLILAA